MTPTASIPPVRKSVRVNTSREHAFEVFTSALDTWWPRHVKIGQSPMKRMVLEPKAGGRWYEVGEDGAEVDSGVVLEWEPPARLLVGWRINAQWKPDVTVESLVEVQFTAVEPGVTLVELEHRAFEALGAEGGASMRRAVDGGWAGLLEGFAAVAEGRSAPATAG